jgi:hypothetical protein
MDCLPISYGKPVVNRLVVYQMSIGVRRGSITLESFDKKEIEPYSKINLTQSEIDRRPIGGSDYFCAAGAGAGCPC